MSVKLISADSHVNPPSDLWLRDAPARLKDRVPRVESTPEGDVWVVDQKASPVQGLTFMGGRDYKDYTPRVAYKEMRPGSWDPKARLRHGPGRYLGRHPLRRRAEPVRRAGAARVLHAAVQRLALRAGEGERRTVGGHPH